MFERDQDKIDPLDEVLATARWPALSSEAEGRLRGRWEELRSRRRMVIGGWAAAAVVVAGVGVWVGVVPRQEAEVVVRSEATTVVVETVAMGREANAAERVVAVTAGLRARPARAGGGESFVAVDACLKAIAAKSGMVGALSKLKEEPDRVRVVEMLFARLGDSRMEVRWAAARALGYLDGPAVTARLARMVEGDLHRREALAALVQSDGTEARDYVRVVSGDRELGAAVRSVVSQIKSF